MLKKVLILCLIISNVGCDQISKDIVRNKVKPNQYIQVYHNNLILTKVENSGAALGLGQNLPPLGKLLLLNIIPLLVLIGLSFWLFRKNEQINWTIIAFTFVIGGGLGNLIDRFIIGSVTDFLHIEIGVFKTGIFNMADVSVTIGAIILLIINLIPNKETISAQ